MFSKTTMASSTTKPIARISAIIDRLFRLKPHKYITANVPSRDTGIARLGMMVAEAFRRKTKITSTTSPKLSSSVVCTSRKESRMLLARSAITRTPMLGGTSLRICGSSARTPLLTSTALLPGCLYTITLSSRSV